MWRERQRADAVTDATAAKDENPWTWESAKEPPPHTLSPPEEKPPRWKTLPPLNLSLPELVGASETLVTGGTWTGMYL